MLLYIVRLNKKLFFFFFPIIFSPSPVYFKAQVLYIFKGTYGLQSPEMTGS